MADGRARRGSARASDSDLFGALGACVRAVMMSSRRWQAETLLPSSHHARFPPRRPPDLCTDVNEVNSDLLQLASEDLALLDTPLLPFSVFTFLREVSPVGGADADEERSFPSITHELDNS